MFFNPLIEWLLSAVGWSEVLILISESFVVVEARKPALFRWVSGSVSFHILIFSLLSKTLDPTESLVVIDWDDVGVWGGATGSLSSVPFMSRYSYRSKEKSWITLLTGLTGFKHVFLTAHAFFFSIGVHLEWVETHFLRSSSPHTVSHLIFSHSYVYK